MLLTGYGATLKFSGHKNMKISLDATRLLFCPLLHPDLDQHLIEEERECGYLEMQRVQKLLRKSKGTTVKVWEGITTGERTDDLGITTGGRTDLVYRLGRFLNAVNYRDIIEGSVALSSAQKVSPQFKFALSYREGHEDIS